MFNFVATDEFKADLANLEDSAQALVKQQLSSLSCLENPLHSSKKIRGHRNIFRFRAGDYRILFILAKKRIILLNVDHRKNVYQGV